MANGKLIKSTEYPFLCSNSLKLCGKNDEFYKPILLKRAVSFLYNVCYTFVFLGGQWKFYLP